MNAMQNTTDKYTDADYQRKVGDFVRREVIYCVSGIVDELIKRDTDEDWYHLVRAFDPDQARELIEDECTKNPESREDIDGLDLEDEDDLREAMDVLRIDEADCAREVYEHWIVSGWIADKLAAKGEAIEKDFYGLTIWGRTTTGQAILMDRVICEIYDELHADDKDA